MAAREWDATTYDRIAGPQTRWGTGVVERLAERLPEGAAVLDAGCGSGRVTEQLLERSSTVRVVALDGSAQMVAQARTRLERFGDRVSFVVADLARPLPLNAPVDGLVSTATFHWVADHEALWRDLAAVLRPGAAVACQYGGAGNLTAVMAALDELGAPPKVNTYPTAAQTEAWLAAAGFTDIECWTHPEPTPFSDRAALAEFLRAVVLSGHAALMDAAAFDALLDQVLDRLPDLTLDYVRLNVDATR